MTPSTVLGTLIPLTVTTVTLRYVIACWLYPFKPHKRCDGAGRFRGMGGLRLCRGCNGTGRVLRVGRRIHNAFTRVRHDIRADRRRDQDRRRELGS